MPHEDDIGIVGTWIRRLGASAEALLLAATAGALLGGVAAYLSHVEVIARVCWGAGTAVGLAAAVAWTVADLRRGRIGVDLIAVLALLGTAATGELFAGAMIAVMLASGRALEARASSRAQRDLRLLLQRAPQTAHRRRGNTSHPGGGRKQDRHLHLRLR